MFVKALVKPVLPAVFVKCKEHVTCFNNVLKLFYKPLKNKK